MFTSSFLIEVTLPETRRLFPFVSQSLVKENLPAEEVREMCIRDRLQVLPHHRHQVVESVFYVTRREGRVGCYFFRKLCGIHGSRTYNSGMEEFFTAFFVFQS